MPPLKFNRIIPGDTLKVLRSLPDACVDCIVTSPPYYALRDYGVDGQIGLEQSLDDYLEKMLAITAELKRVLKAAGTVWWNHGDSYGKDKSLLMQPFRLAQRMIDEQGWLLRNIVVWHKPNVLPASPKDRFLVDYEPIFFFTKSKKYWFETQFEVTADLRSLQNQLSKSGVCKQAPPSLGKHKRTIWKVPTKPFKDAHFATFPELLIEVPILAGCPEFICEECERPRVPIFEPSDEYKKLLGRDWMTKDRKGKQAWLKTGLETKGMLQSTTADYRKTGYTDCGCNAEWDPGIVLDPFMGAGTTAVVAQRLRRRWLGIELNPEYIKIAERRIREARFPIIKTVKPKHKKFRQSELDEEAV